jgi:hypothetical protein
MKAYVLGYNEKEAASEPEENLFKPVHEVAYGPGPKWTWAMRRDAEVYSQLLSSWRIHVGSHYCEFSIELLPDGEFTIVCESNLDGSHPGLLSAVAP